VQSLKDWGVLYQISGENQGKNRSFDKLRINSVLPEGMEGEDRLHGSHWSYRDVYLFLKMVEFLIRLLKAVSIEQILYRTK